MNAPVTLTAAVLLAGATSVAVQLAMAPTDPPRGPEAAAPNDLSGIEARLDSLRAENEALRGELNDLRLGGPQGPTRVPVGEIEDAVRRALAEANGSAGRPEGEDAQAPIPVEDLLAELFALDDELGRQHFWQRMREEGRLDDVVAAFEARAAAAPDDPQRQLELGQAYLQKIQEVGNGPLAGVLATKADAAFDAALDADPQHWDARFHKAIALSFWPPVFGKQNEAIAQFQMLVAQQGGLAPKPQHAQTHLLLGNMYQQIGATDKALAAWQAGLAIFPDNADLAAQLALVQGGDH